MSPETEKVQSLKKNTVPMDSLPNPIRLYALGNYRGKKNMPSEPDRPPGEAVYDNRLNLKADFHGKFLPLLTNSQPIKD